MRPHEKLEVWNQAIEFVIAVYKLTEIFPKEEKFALTPQIRRMAVSVPANLAEGAAGQSNKEFTHFLSNAQGSARELDTELLIAYKLGYITENDYFDLRGSLDNSGRMISGLIQHLKRRIQ